MKNILVPVDFHDTSFSALLYATKLAEKVDHAKITLIHVLNGLINTHEVAPFDPLKTLQEATLARLKYFVEEYPKSKGIKLGDVQIEYKTTFGIPGFSIADFAEEYNMDLIIMGTRDKHGIFDRIIGSSSAIAARQAKCPVLFIHKDVNFHPLKRVVFAIDNKTDIEDALSDLKKINYFFNAHIDFVHFTDDVENSDVSDVTEDILDSMFGEKESTSFTISTIQSEDLLDSLVSYCDHSAADMLAMTHRNEGVFSGIFRTKNSIKVAQSLKLPTIIFHE